MQSLNEIKTQSKRKLCYDLFTFEDKTIKEISTELSISRQTVSKYIKLYNLSNPTENLEVAIVQQNKPKKAVPLQNIKEADVKTKPSKDEDVYKLLDPEIVKLLKDKS